MVNGPIILSGITGSGKSEIANRLVLGNKMFINSAARVTTRGLRSDEKEGTGITVMVRSRFEELMSQGAIIGAYEGPGGELYGVYKDELVHEIAQGNPLITFGGMDEFTQHDYLVSLIGLSREIGCLPPVYMTIRRNNRDAQMRDMGKRDLPQHETVERVKRIFGDMHDLRRTPIMRLYLGLASVPNIEGEIDFVMEEVRNRIRWAQQVLSQGRLFREKPERV